MGALVLLAVLVTIAWMGVDASKRDFTGSKFADATWKWVLGGLVLWIVVLPVYLVLRERAPRKAAGASGAIAYPPAPAPEGWLAPAAADSVAPPSASVPPPGFRD